MNPPPPQHPRQVIVPPDARCWSEVDLAALRRNVARLIEHHPGKRIIPIVKADAYGHGLAAVAPVAVEAGASMLAVANLGEARHLHNCGYRGDTLLLSPLLPDEKERLFQLNPIPVLTVSSAEELAFWENFAHREDRILRAHLKIDTGMGRIGQWHESIAEVGESIQQLSSLRLEGAYTHYSCAESDFAWTLEQTRRFRTALARLHLDSAKPGFWIHGENSAALRAGTSGGEGLYNAARVGIACYGVSPFAENEDHQYAPPLEPVLSLRAKIVSVKRLPAGTPISYGATHRLQRPSILGALGAGYAEGIAFGLGNRGTVLGEGVRCPVIGRVTMDQIIVDLTEHPSTIQPGTIATLIGENGGKRLTAREYAQAANTIPWQVLSCLTARVWRCYFDAG